MKPNIRPEEENLLEVSPADRLDLDLANVDLTIKKLGRTVLTCLITDDPEGTFRVAMLLGLVDDGVEWRDSLIVPMVRLAVALGEIGRFDAVVKLLAKIGHQAEDPTQKDWTGDEAVARGCVEVGNGDFASAAVSLNGDHAPGLPTVFANLANAVLFDSAERLKDSRRAMSDARKAFSKCSELRQWMGRTNDSTER